MFGHIYTHHRQIGLSICLPSSSRLRARAGSILDRLPEAASALGGRDLWCEGLSESASLPSVTRPDGTSMLLRLPIAIARDAGRVAVGADLAASGLLAVRVGTGRELFLTGPRSDAAGGRGSDEGVEAIRDTVARTAGGADAGVPFDCPARRKLVFGVTGPLAYCEGSSAERGRNPRSVVFAAATKRGRLLGGVLGFQLYTCRREAR